MEKTKEVLHTQGEWKVITTGGIIEPFLINCGKIEIAAMKWGIKSSVPEVLEEVQANAELICKAVNERQRLIDSNRELLLALKEAEYSLETLSEADCFDEDDKAALRNAREIITKNS